MKIKPPVGLSAELIVAHSLIYLVLPLDKGWKNGSLDCSCQKKNSHSRPSLKSSLESSLICSLDLH